ncbi:uncharacterized protein LOC111254319 [Varroa destructor]|uniref:A-kinase anchor protein 7-like phosphoesterase domain-containing protein n=1 Tax=Varroa destructor TaxID=109461 RepID=A0A7M7KRS8_VARDE|nr:uncharacterized protein LOC111254319 [Varroa destructor]
MSRYAEHDDWRGECLEASARKSSTLYDRHEIKYRPYTKVFIGCQIDDPAIRDRIFKLQQRLIQGTPSARRFLQPLCQLHLTVCTARIDENQRAKISSSVMNEAARTCIPDILFCPDASLRLRGLGQFDDHRVIYVKVDPLNFDLYKLNRSFAELFGKTSYSLSEYDSYTPHITIFQIRGRLDDRRCIRQTYKQLSEEDIDFGVQRIKNIQLLDILLPKNDCE